MAFRGKICTPTNVFFPVCSNAVHPGHSAVSDKIALGLGWRQDDRLAAAGGFERNLTSRPQRQSGRRPPSGKADGSHKSKNKSDPL
jgi:hypothetical protein